MQNKSSKATHGGNDQKPNVTEHEKKGIYVLNSLVHKISSFSA